METLLQVLTNESFQSGILFFIAALSYLKLIEVLGGKSQVHTRMTIEETEVFIQFLREEAERNHKAS